MRYPDVTGGHALTTATVEQVQAHLPELIDRLAPGDGLLITRDGKPVARLTPAVPVGVPVAGRGKGKLVIHSDADVDPDTFAGSVP